MDDYVRLIEEFCLSQDIQDFESVLHEGLIDFEEIPMRLEFLEATGQCRAMADLGEIPEEHESRLFALMLEENFEGTDSGLPVLSVNPETGRAVVSIHLDPAETLSRGGLAQAVDTYMIPCVNWWKDVIDEVESHTSRPLLPAHAYGTPV